MGELDVSSREKPPEVGDLIDGYDFRIITLIARARQQELEEVGESPVRALPVAIYGQAAVVGAIPQGIVGAGKELRKFKKEDFGQPNIFIVDGTASAEIREENQRPIKKKIESQSAKLVFIRFQESVDYMRLTSVEGPQDSLWFVALSDLALKEVVERADTIV